MELECDIRKMSVFYGGAGFDLDQVPAITITQQDICLNQQVPGNKRGHDAPTYGLIDSILQTSKTPSAALHDLDANKPGGSIKIRVKTYAHSLRLQQERLEDLTARRRELGHAIDRKRLVSAPAT